MTIKFPVASPYFSGEEKKLVLECLDSGWISSQGKFIAEFEQEFAKFIGVRHAIATNNGTTALHLALVALGVGPGDEVIVPTMTYIATANAVRYCGATPVFVDSDPADLTLSLADVRRKFSPKTKGVLAVHLYGMVADLNGILEFATEKGIWLLEDAAESHGAQISGKMVGGVGTIGAFSFFGNKIITTGEGGMLVTNDDHMAQKMAVLRNQGMSPLRRYWFDEVGFNYRMTNVQAAIGLAQLKKVDYMLKERDRVFNAYSANLRAAGDSIRFLTPRIDSSPVTWLVTIQLPKASENQRDELIIRLAQMGIETRPTFYPLTTMPPYAEKTSYPVAQRIAASSLNLPTYVELSNANVAEICNNILEIGEQLGLISRRWRVN